MQEALESHTLTILESLKRDWVLKGVLKRKNVPLISKISGFAFDYVLIRTEVALKPEGLS